MIPKQPVTMADVAAHAGVSIATVSRSLRGGTGVSERTRQRIRSVADELSYVISPEASRLSGGSETGRVAIVVPFVDAWFYSTLIAGAEAVLRDAGLDVLLICLDTAAQRDAFFEDLPLRRKVDAVLIAAVPMRDGQCRRLVDTGVQVVSIGEAIVGASLVSIDDAEVAAQAVTHLLRIGHRRIAMIGAVTAEGHSYQSNRVRERGYRDTMTAAGLAPAVVTPTWGVEGGAAAMESLLSERIVPTAVFCHSDEVAVGALLMARRAGLSVPADLSITGVDDHPMADVLDLTTVRQPVRDQGDAAARLIVERIATPRTTLLPTRLVVRGSTARPPEDGSP